MSIVNHVVAQGAERRRHTRAKINFRVHIRGGVGTQEVFEDIGKSLDVTRDGVLLSTSRGGYWVDQLLEVTCPYWGASSPIDIARRALVIRSSILPGGAHGVALEYQEINGNGTAHWMSSPFQHQVRVLGVEPDPHLARATRDLLERDGYNVVFVSTAQQALDTLSNESPDVIVLGVEGQGISSHDLCTIVKTDDKLQHIPVILLMSSALPADYAASRELGAVVCMAKPCLPERVQLVVHLVAPPPASCSVYSAKFNVGPFVRTS